MNRIIIMAKNRNFPKSISLREAIKLHAETTEALTQCTAQSSNHFSVKNNFREFQSTTNPLGALGFSARNEGGHHVTAHRFQQTSAGVGPTASAHNGDVS